MTEYDDLLEKQTKRNMSLYKEILINELAESQLKLSAICRPLGISGAEARTISPENLEYLVKGILFPALKQEEK